MTGALRVLIVAGIATAVATEAAPGGSEAVGTRGSWLALVQGGDESQIVLMKPSRFVRGGRGCSPPATSGR